MSIPNEKTLIVVSGGSNRSKVGKAFYSKQFKY